ncbi:hypothetical protein AZI86_12415 [Bdellovibrio bacteriovorus]|uniref:Uncharacterized protein n=1 Tax=Bdellovibrio bacteriovorus TaxID=959 RepID=A0A150WIN4_BDEBC|nr:hypothetical protein [Bdellovibrio bacteriovorus]KYG63628.1 hypothetical protein AZI86_12415 [Bdellovibrio bacteriovorus]
MEENIQALDELNRRNLEMLFSISPWTIVGGLIFGILGVWIFRKARKEGNIKLMWVGVAMMAYQLFTMDPIAIWAIGISLSALAYRWK